MGLADRDYMWDRERSRTYANKTKLRDTLWTILAAVAGCYLLYKTYGWVEFKKPQPPANITQQKPVVKAEPQVNFVEYTPPAQKEVKRQPATPNYTYQTSTQQSITKCNINGTVTYTDKECPTSAQRSSVLVDTANVGTTTHINPDTSQQSNQTLVASQNPEQIQPVRQTAYPQQAQQASNKAAECVFLKQQIEQIDAIARQPQSASTQDRLAADRRKVRDRQHTLGC